MARQGKNGAAGAAPTDDKTGAGHKVSAGNKTAALDQASTGMAVIKAGRRIALPLGLVGAGAGAVMAVARVAVRREQARPDAVAADELDLPGDLDHGWVRMDDGAEIHTVEAGSGPPMILLHGITLSVATWVYQLRELAAGHRVLAIDQRGHGQSKGGQEDLGIDRLSLDLLAVMAEKKIKKAVVVGHSMGGMVALHSVINHPDEFKKHVKGLALVATSGGPLSRVPGLLAVAELLQPGLRYRFNRFEARGRPVLPPGELSYWLARVSLGRRPSRRHVALTAQMVADVSPATLSGLLGAVLSFDLSRHLGDVDLPALVAVGTNDRLTPAWMAHGLEKGLNQAELKEFDGAGHMLMLERHEELSQALDSFATSLR